MRHVFQSGYFEQLVPRAEDTRDGVKLTLEVLALQWLAGRWLRSKACNARAQKQCCRAQKRACKTKQEALLRVSESQLATPGRGSSAAPHTHSSMARLVAACCCQLLLNAAPGSHRPVAGVQVKPNPKLENITVQGANVLPQVSTASKLG